MYRAQLAETLTRAESRPSLENSDLMSQVMVWNCQEWSILRWLWREVVTNPGYSDRRLRGVYLLAGGERQEDTFQQFLSLLKSQHQDEYEDMMQKIRVSTYLTF